MAYVTKRPLNQLETPAYPIIQQGPPRMVNAKKHWTVDTGATLSDYSNDQRMYGDAVLYQRRNANQYTSDLISSHKEYVNLEFRPPLLDPYLDMYSLTRQPIKPPVVRVNPNGGYYKAQIQVNDSNVEGYLQNKPKVGALHSTFYRPSEGNMYGKQLMVESEPLSSEQGSYDLDETGLFAAPNDEYTNPRRMPKLRRNLPSYSATTNASATWVAPPLIDEPNIEKFTYVDRPLRQVHSGVTMPVKHNGAAPTVNLKGRRNLSNSTTNYNMQESGNRPIGSVGINQPRIELQRKLPEYSVSTNLSSPFRSNSLGMQSSKGLRQPRPDKIINLY